VTATGGAGAFTDGSVYLTNGNPDCTAGNTRIDGRDYGTSNFLCNPSRIDGLSIVNSSQGGGGVFIHGWAHNLEVANTRISGNHGTLAGGINLGNGETPDAFVNDGVECGTGLVGAAAAMPCPPIPAGTVLNAAIPFQFNTKVHVHHNMIYNNASIGDALFSGTPSGAGAITISSGSDDYLLDHNWMAGNLSTGDGGGVQHLGLSFRGNIKNNYILFNQSTNPTLPTNGGGLIIEGANLDRMLNGQECGSTNDQDCPPGLGEGSGPGIVVDSNLILGNSAEDGSGGGLRIQQVNGSEVVAFPTGPDPRGGNGGNASPGWYDITVTNNVIANNVAGWDGGGVSIQDAFKVTFVNNTVASNDTTASAGVLFKTLGAINAASPPPGCTPTTDPTLPQNPSCTGNSAPHGPQPAGLVVMYNTPNMIAALAPAPGFNTVTCPADFGYAGGTGSGNLNNADCRRLSKPKMMNDLLWQNRAFSVQIIGSGTGNQSQQNLVALTPQLNQGSTGDCSTGAATLPNSFFWDIGMRTDDFGNVIPATTRLAVTNSIYTKDTQGVITASATNSVGGASSIVAQYCNGARVPPENCASQTGQITQASCKGYNTPVGASETTSLAQAFQFNGIQPTATVDEGHNWLNLVYGPLTLSRPKVNNPTNPEMMVASGSVGTLLGAYSIRSGSLAIGRGTTTGAPNTAGHDFFGNARTGHNDAGAVQFTLSTSASVSPSTVSFGNVRLNTTSTPQTVTLTAGNTALTGITVTGLPAPVFSRPAGAAGGTCGATLAANTACTIIVQFAPTTSGLANASMTIAATGQVITGSPVALSGTGSKVDLSVTPNTLVSFGDVFFGMSSTVQTVTLTNTASPAGPVTGINFTGLASPFTRATGAAAGTCPTTASFTLVGGTNCTIGVVFTPTAVNPAAGLLTVTAGATFGIDGSPVQLSGNGLLPAVTPASVDFGTVPVGTTVTQTLTLDNSNNVNSNNLAFPISTLMVTGTGFSRAGTPGTTGNTCPAAGGTLAAGATCTIRIQFSQVAGTSATGLTMGSVTIKGNTNLTSLPNVTLTANSVAATHIATISPNPLAFGNQTVGTTSATQNLTVANTGNSALANLTIAGVTTATSPFTRVTTGAFPANAPNCAAGTTLAVGASCTVKVRFAPTVAGSPTATVTVGATILDAPPPPHLATLTGTGVAPLVSFTGATNPGSLSGNTLAFGNQPGTVSSTVTIKVVGGGQVVFGTATVAGTRFNKGADTCSGNTVAAGGTCTIEVNFNGAGNTNRTGTLAVVDSTGTAIAPVLNLTGS